VTVQNKAPLRITSARRRGGAQALLGKCGDLSLSSQRAGIEVAMDSGRWVLVSQDLHDVRKDRLVKEVVQLLEADFLRGSQFQLASPKECLSPAKLVMHNVLEDSGSLLGYGAGVSRSVIACSIKELDASDTQVATWVINPCARYPYVPSSSGYEDGGLLLTPSCGMKIVFQRLARRSMRRAGFS